MRLTTLPNPILPLAAHQALHASPPYSGEAGLVTTARSIHPD